MRTMRAWVGDSWKAAMEAGTTAMNPPTRGTISAKAARTPKAMAFGTPTRSRTRVV